jgi:hypothetical protein
MNPLRHAQPNDSADADSDFASLKRPAADAAWLAWGGALLCALAVLFTWGQLAIDSEYLLAVAALFATGLAVWRRPARRPDLGVSALVAIAAVSGAWFAGGTYLGLVDANAFHPLPLLLGLGASTAGTVAVALTTWRSSGERRQGRLVYALVALAMMASAATYYQLFTVGVAEHQVARRLVLTLVWLASGLALFVRSRGRASLQNGGRILVAAAYAKALFYDTTHLDGGLRIAALLLTGGLLLGGAYALSRRQAV